MESGGKTSMSLIWLIPTCMIFYLIVREGYGLRTGKGAASMTAVPARADGTATPRQTGALMIGSMPLPWTKMESSGSVRRGGPAGMMGSNGSVTPPGVREGGNV